MIEFMLRVFEFAMWSAFMFTVGFGCGSYWEEKQWRK